MLAFPHASGTLPSMFRAVSLGSNCMVSYETRKYFEFDCAYPFDWWVTPAAALLDLIRHDFWGLFDGSTLQIVGDGRSVLNTRYGLLHHHDFARNEQGFVERITEWDLGCNRLKFAHIVDRWNALNQRVLFVRYEWDAGAGLIPKRLGRGNS
jgi:Putative papain-like cysteine peptidase (DUF1796)